MLEQNPVKTYHNKTRVDIKNVIGRNKTTKTPPPNLMLTQQTNKYEFPIE